MALALSTLTLPSATEACAFHTYMPEQTAVDRIVEAEDLILARPTTANAFAYEAVETLRGVPPTSGLDFLVSSSWRTQLAASPGDAVLFARPPGGDWALVTYVDDAFRPLLQDVLARSAMWEASYGADRFAIFAGLLDHSDPALRDLALSEIDKAPYALLGGIGPGVDASRILADLRSPRRVQFRSINILLLGLSGEDAARDEIRRYVDTAARHGITTHLGAYATALVEIDGTAGVARLERAMLADPAQPLEKLEQVVEALAIQNGVGGADLGDAISATLSRFVTTRPEAAPLVARQFGSRGDWSQSDVLEHLVRERRLASTADLMAVAVYVAQARAAEPS